MGKSRAFTLVELLIVMAILIILAVIMVAIINPIALTGKGLDARRKKDIGRIRVAFEEYQSDKGCYPSEEVVGGLMLESSCRSNIFEPWLNNWPCDPATGRPYIVIVGPNQSTCPSWFRILVNLENREDPEIPDGWYLRGDDYHIGAYGIEDVNYGTSSTNVSWDDYVLDSSCRWYADNHSFDECYVKSVGGGGCSGAINNACSGDNCYARNDCHLTDICKVSCCGSACN